MSAIDRDIHYLGVGDEKSMTERLATANQGQRCDHREYLFIGP